MTKQRTRSQLETSRARFLLTSGTESLGHLNRRKVWKIPVEAATKLRATDKPRIWRDIPSIFQLRDREHPIKLKYDISETTSKVDNRLDTKTKYVFKGVTLTIFSAVFAVIGLIVASTQNLVAGIFIVVGSSIFWGYACLLSTIAKLRLKERQS